MTLGLKSSAVPRKWIALDTETIDGRAFLLSSAAGCYRLESFDSFVNVLESFHPASFVFYNIDYDVSALIKHFDARTIKLLYLDRRVNVETASRRLWLRYIPGKVFKIGDGNRSYACYDLLSFFQTSLNKAALKYLGESKRDLPADYWKGFTLSRYESDRLRFEDYAQQDARLTQSLVDKLTDSIRSTGLSISALYSPGYLAKSYLKDRKLRVNPLSDETAAIAQACYFGGRIETMKRGAFASTALYDITSAYPAAIAALPDLLHASYIRSKTQESPTALFRLLIHSEPEAPFYLLPFRTAKGLIVYPRHNEVTRWVTPYEKTVLDRSGANYTILDVLNVLANPAPTKLSRIVTELFEKRKAGNFEAIVYKLILNSLYGIFAESRTQYKRIALPKAILELKRDFHEIAFEQYLALARQECKSASRWYLRECKCSVCKSVRRLRFRLRLPKRRERIVAFEDDFFSASKLRGRFSNLMLAAFITAYVRSFVYAAISPFADRVIATMTDAVLLDESAGLVPFSYNEGEKSLGTWGLQYRGPAIVLGSGVYELGEITKSRGFKLRGEKLAAILAACRTDIAKIAILDRESIGRFTLSAYERFDSFNVLTEAEKELRLNFDTKRVWQRDFACGPEVLSTIVGSRAFTLNGKGELI